MGDIETGDANLDRRRRLHDALAARLAALSDDALAAQLAEAAAGRANDNGNQSAVIDVEGGKVFVKQIALTDVERRAANKGIHRQPVRPAALLPIRRRLGGGRRLARAERVRAGRRVGAVWECPYFPLVYHWRVLPRTPPPPSDKQRALVQGATDYRDHSDAVRARLEAIAGGPRPSPSSSNMRQRRWPRGSTRDRPAERLTTPRRRPSFASTTSGAPPRRS